MNNLKEKVLNKIKKGEVKKRPLIYFMSKNYFFWFMFILSIVLGAVAFSSFIIHFIIEPGPWHKLVLKKGGFYYVFKALPLLWLVIILVFTLAAWLNFKHTERAYRQHNFLIVLVSIVMSMLLGLLLFFSGIGRNLDLRMRKLLPGYEKYHKERMESRRKFLESIGIDPEEFMKHRRLKNCERFQCKIKVK